MRVANRGKDAPHNCPVRKGAHLFIVAADRDRSPVAAGGKPHGVRIGHAPQRAAPLRAGTARDPLADGPAEVRNHGVKMRPGVDCAICGFDNFAELAMLWTL